MFEKITKGKCYVSNECRGLYRVKSHEDIIIADAESMMHPMYPTPEGAQQNAEFIAYCFNLQQRFDISKLEELVTFLEDALSPHTDLELQQMESYGKKLLTKIKK